MATVLMDVRCSRVESEPECRRYKRFDPDSLGARISMLATESGAFRCELVDLSYAGMCLRSYGPLQPGREYSFLIRLQKPMRDSVLVKARVLWVRSLPGRDMRVGLRFVESSKGWLGSEESDRA